MSGSPADDQGCPKHMVMGPCGGVQTDGGCEVGPHPCAFPAPATWSDPVLPVPLDAVPLILTDFSSEPYSLSAHAAVAGILAPVSDAVLVGEHQDRPDFPPAQLASILQQAGARPWITLSCRDRNRVVLEQELHGLRELGVGAVLCVTGDAGFMDAAARAGVTIPVIGAGTRVRREDQGGVGRPDPGRVCRVTREISGAMEAEFDTVADWTARVAADLGPDYYIPAACRGSGQPAVLDWLLERLEPRPGEVMIDVGAGMGGPAAYAGRRTGVRPVLAEPEPGACRAAARLFGAPVVQADATALPFGAAAADLAWCLAVLCTASGAAAQRAILGQLRRVTRPDGRIGLLVYLAAAAELDNPPQGNHFPSSGQLHGLLCQTGLEVVEVAGFGDVIQPPPDWAVRAEAVERELHRRYGHAPELAAADEQSNLFGRLLSSGQVIAQGIVLRVAADC